MKKCKECIYRYKDTGKEYCLCDNNKEVRNNKEKWIEGEECKEYKRRCDECRIGEGEIKVGEGKYICKECNKERKIKKIEKIKESIREKSKGREEVYKVMIEVYDKIIEEIREE